MITHLEPDILECEVKWALGSITTNKASGGDGIPVDLFQILKDDAVKVLHSIYQQIWKTPAVATGLEKVSFHSNPKKDNAKECPNYHTIVLISHASKVMLKNLQARLQQCVNHELPHVQAGFRKGRRTRDQIANIHWIIEKTGELQKTSTFALLTMPKHLCGSQQSVENYSRDGDTRSPDLPPEKSICRSRSNSYTGHGTTDWLQIWKGVHQGCILLLCLFNLYAEYIMQNAGLDEAQAGYCWEKYQ